MCGKFRRRPAQPRTSADTDDSVDDQVSPLQQQARCPEVELRIIDPDDVHGSPAPLQPIPCHEGVTPIVARADQQHDPGPGD